jgi:heme/copper-type cytochrome/quinol oxidase subunit 3
MDGDSPTGREKFLSERGLHFSLKGLLFFGTFIAVLITALAKWTAVAPQLQGKSVPIHVIYLGSWQLILIGSAIVIMGACSIELHRQSTAPPRPRLAIAVWMLLAAAFTIAAVLDWRETHATGSEGVAELGTIVVFLLGVCGLFCFYHGQRARRLPCDSNSKVS